MLKSYILNYYVLKQFINLSFLCIFNVSFYSHIIVWNNTLVKCAVGTFSDWNFLFSQNIRIIQLFVTCRESLIFFYLIYSSSSLSLRFSLYKFNFFLTISIETIYKDTSCFRNCNILRFWKFSCLWFTPRKLVSPLIVLVMFSNWSQK